MTAWSAYPPNTEWTMNVPTITTISAQSTQYITASVNAPNDPTSASVSFAFLGPYATPQQAGDQVVTSTTTFTTGSWQSGSTSNPYIAQILVGPAQSVVLTDGTYAVWIKIADSPETPILFSGPLVVN